MYFYIFSNLKVRKNLNSGNFDNSFETLVTLLSKCPGISKIYPPIVDNRMFCVLSNALLVVNTSQGTPCISGYKLLYLFYIWLSLALLEYLWLSPAITGYHWLSLSSIRMQVGARESKFLLYIFFLLFFTRAISRGVCASKKWSKEVA